MSYLIARWHGFWTHSESHDKPMRRELIKLVDYITLFIAILALASVISRHRLGFDHVAQPAGTNVANSAGHAGGL